MAQQTLSNGENRGDFRSAINSMFTEVYASVAALVLGTRTRSAQTGTSYQLVAGDAGNVVSLNNAGAVTLTIPANATVAFAVETQIDWMTLGAGQVTFTPAGGVTMRSSGGKTKSTGQYSAGTLYKIGTNEWLLAGDIST